MIGQSLALISGIGFAGSSVSIRQAVFRTKESTTPVFTSTFFGTVIFSLVLLLSGNAQQLKMASPQAIAALAGAGIVVFVLGTRLHYYSLKLIGANRGGPLLSSSTLVAVILGITLMNEPFTWFLALGSCFIVVGIVLVSSESGGESIPGSATTKRDIVKGVAAGLCAGICFGGGPVLIKIAIDEGNSPFMALFVSYLTALLLMFIHRLTSHKLGELIIYYKKAMAPMTTGAISVSIAHLCRYLSLDYIPVSVVVPLTSTANLFIIILSFIMNRKIELFTWKIITGSILVVSGVFLVFQV
jgi:drug/metabolite transporter (DMT)-like permease